MERDMYLTETEKTLLAGMDIDPDTFNAKSLTGIALGSLVRAYARHHEAALDALRSVQQDVNRALEAGQPMQFSFADISKTRRHDEALAAMNALNEPLITVKITYLKEQENTQV